MFTDPLLPFHYFAVKNGKKDWAIRMYFLNRSIFSKYASALNPGIPHANEFMAFNTQVHLKLQNEFLWVLFVSGPYH